MIVNHTALQSNIKRLLQNTINSGRNLPSIKNVPTSGSGLSFREIMARRFRVGILSEEQQGIFQQCLDNCFATKSPVEFCIPIGGYKKWRLSVFPESDWAELFHLSFMRDIAFRIAAKYNFGVKITYIWDDMAAVEINFNHFPPKSIQDYCSSFRVLLDYYNSLCSELNITFSLKKMTDYYNKDRYSADFRRSFEEAETFWNSGDNSDLTQDLEDRARIHYYDESGEVGQSLTRKAAQQIWAHSQVFSNPVFVDTNIQIPVLLRKAPSRYLHLRSYYTSEVQFWVGEGVIIKGTKKLFPTIISSDDPRHYRLECTVPTEEFSHLGKNFKGIKVLTKITDGE